MSRFRRLLAICKSLQRVLIISPYDKKKYSEVYICLQANGQLPRAAVAGVRVPAVRPRTVAAAAAAGAHAGARAGAARAALRAHGTPPRAFPSAGKFFLNVFTINCPPRFHTDGPADPYRILV